AKSAELDGVGVVTRRLARDLESSFVSALRSLPKEAGSDFSEPRQSACARCPGRRNRSRYRSLLIGPTAPRRAAGLVCQEDRAAPFARVHLSQGTNCEPSRLYSRYH